jgi:hypothetical protein
MSANISVQDMDCSVEKRTIKKHFYTSEIYSRVLDLSFAQQKSRDWVVRSSFKIVLFHIFL